MTISDRRVLVVDDDRDFAESLADALDIWGYEVEVVHSGEDAIRRCSESNFDLALMDVRMPNKNGVDSFLEIQQLKPDFRVVLMTGFSMPGVLAQALAQGARATVSKPLVPEKLVELIEKHRQRQVILVIDDDEDFAASLATSLEDSGYAATIAADGESALGMVALDPPAAILLDLRLPKGSGLEVFCELEKRNLQVPTIVISAYIEQETDTLRALRNQGVAGILEKPFLSNELLSMLAEISG
jgi:CheY-like chemotaxis protein